MTTTTDDSTTEQPTEQSVIVLDPATVQVNPINARKKLRGIPELTKSIREVGVLEPVLVRSIDGNGTYMLVAGERRRAAAIAAGVKLPALLLPEAQVPAWEALAMLSENESRDGLSTAERVRAVQTALDLGVEKTAIAAAAGTSVKNVEAMETVASSKVASGVAEKYDLTLEQAAVLTEFDDDKETVKALTVIALERPGSWDWQVESARRARKERIANETKLAPYREAGVKELTDDELAETSTDWRRGSSNRLPISMLVTDKGKKLTPAGHRNCEGRSVGVFRYYGYKDAEVTEFCEEPKQHGHRLARSSSPTSPSTSQSRGAAQTPEQQEEASAERKMVRDNNKAMDIANTVRVAYVKELVSKTKLPKGVERFVTEAIVVGYDRTPSDSMLSEITGRTIQSFNEGAAELVAALPDNRVLMALLAYVAAATEGIVDKTVWRRADDNFVLYLRFLESTGYELAPVEQVAIDRRAEEQARLAAVRGK